MFVKKVIVLTVFLILCCVSVADPIVTDISAKQRFPWNGLVDINARWGGD